MEEFDTLLTEAQKRGIGIVVGFVIYNKKFIIDEKMYAQIVADLKDNEN